jgi:predicted type IV restriction endonuclease
MVKHITGQAIGDRPIEPKLIEMMNALARGLDEILNGGAKGEARKNGFILMVFPFDSHEGRCNYVSNANRDDIVVLLREQLRRFEGAPDAMGQA